MASELESRGGTGHLSEAGGVYPGSRLAKTDVLRVSKVGPPSPSASAQVATQEKSIGP